jgi:pimeloyl-ACP methyl ester carboxylesterase
MTGAPVNDRAALYVHGLWMPGAEGWVLRRRLATDWGLQVEAFHYHSTHESVAGIVAALHRQVQAMTATRLDFIGHSLGGIVILRYLEQHTPQRPGRVVLLGTPAQGCAAARQLARSEFARHLLGPAVAEELLQPHPRHWSLGRDLGIIAGTHSLSLGKLVLRFSEPNDGTVTVSETRLPGAAAHLCLGVSHTGMLFSRQVAHHTGHFLEHGRFELEHGRPER